MNDKLAQDAADTLRAYEAQAKRFAPKPAEKPAGRFEHFTTEAARREHEEWIKAHETKLPF